MTQNEFLTTLRKALNGQVSPEIVSENLSYYQSYIAGEMNKGRNEEEILDELGDPRLIARTIIDADGGAGRTSSRGQTPDYDSYGYSYTTSDESPEQEDYNTLRHKSFHINKWAAFGILFLILFIIISVLYVAFKTVFKLLFSFHGLWFWIIILLIIYFLSRRQ